MRADEIRLLRSLRDRVEGIPESSLKKGTHGLVQRLVACGAARFVLGRSGRGRRIMIENLEAFERLVASELPCGLDFIDDDIDSHASAVVYQADAKAFAGSIAEAVLLRSPRSDIVVHRCDRDLCIEVSRLTAVAGCAAIRITDYDEWRFSGTIAVIENADAFWEYEEVLPDVDLAIYAGGRISGRLLRLLASAPMQSCSIIHWGDYDPVGIDEYVRLHDACGDRVSAYVPVNIEELLRKFGNSQLIQSNVKTLERIRKRRSIPYVSRMLDLFDRHHRGLEQEILLHHRGDFKP